MLKPAIMRKMEAVENLPTLPAIVEKIQNLAADPRTNMDEIASVVERDQAIAARVIRLVNSAFYSLPERIGSIQRAIMILGLNTVKNLVLGVSVVKSFGSFRSGFFNRDKFWLHALSCAMGAKLLAQHLGNREPEDFLLAGLLHDIGILVTDQFLHAQFAEIIGESDQQGDYLAAERGVLGADHGEVGYFLAQEWKIPEFIGQSIRHHHNPGAVPRNDKEGRHRVAVVHLADVKSRSASPDSFLRNFKSPACPWVLKYFKAEEFAVNEIFEKVGTEVESIAKEWGI